MENLINVAVLLLGTVVLYLLVIILNWTGLVEQMGSLGRVTIGYSRFRH